MKRKRLLATTAVATALIAAFCYIPLPYSIKCALEVQPRDAHVVYATVPGTLQCVDVRPGARVENGATIAQLQNDDLRLSVHELDRAVKLYEKQLEVLEYQASVRGNTDAAGRIPEVQELLTSVREQWQKEQDDLNKLLIKASTAGTVLPAPVKKPPPNVDGRLPQWSGSLLDPINLGTFIEPNDQLCLIGDPQQYEALLAVDQSDLDYLKPGQRVRVKLDSYAGDVIKTEIKTQDDISRTPMEFASQSMSVQAGGKLATRTDAAGVTRPLSTTYQVTVPLPGDARLYKPGLRGRAKVSADPRSLGWRLMHFITRTFRFDL